MERRIFKVIEFHSERIVATQNADGSIILTTKLISLHFGLAGGVIYGWS